MIKSIHIENFRSIKDLHFEPKSLCALVGPNSVGKTNVLKALDLILGEGWATKAKVAKELFHDTALPINIRVEFKEFIAHSHYGTAVRIHYITLNMEMYPEFKCEVRLRSNDDDKEYYVNDEFKRKCHFIYIPSNRDLASHARVNNWTLIGKLMKEVYQSYVRYYGGDEDSLKEKFKGLMAYPKEFLEADFDEDSLTFKKFSDSFVKNCTDNSAGLASGMKPELNIYNLNWFYKTLQITLTENHSDKVFDSEDVGSGVQNLILLSIFQTYAELMGGSVIFGIEEPEIFLYPQAQRALYKNFQKISLTSQIFYTTHNPNFIDAVRAYEIEILSKNKEEGTINKQKSEVNNRIQAEKERFKIYYHFNTERNELFFAKKVILVEGDSDKIFFYHIIEKHWGIDLDKNGISIISCDGKGGVSYFTGLCRAMGIVDYFSIWDEDEELEKPQLLNQTKEIKKGLELAPNLEGYLMERLDIELSKDSSKKIKQAYTTADEIMTNEIATGLFNELKVFVTQ